jgi:hypothetical protein
VCYAIPIFLGPPGEVFNTTSPVILDIAHNAGPARHTKQLKFFVKSEGDDPTWREGGDYFCVIGKDGRAVIQLRHFSQFVIGVDPSTTTSFPPVRARLVTGVRDFSDTTRSLVTCIAFDWIYMLKVNCNFKTLNEIIPVTGLSIACYRGRLSARDLALRPNWQQKLFVF